MEEKDDRKPVILKRLAMSSLGGKMMNLLHRNCFIKLIIFSATIVVVLSFSCQTGSALEKSAKDQPKVG
jgi:hypothetical protein